MGLFPTPISQVYLDRVLSLTEKEYLKKLPLVENKSNKISYIKDILSSPELSSLKEFINKELDIFFTTVYNTGCSAKVYITQSWLNVTHPGESHHKHIHRNSFLSGVFYVQADKNLDTITFFKSYNPLMFDLDPTEYNVFNSDQWEIPVETGKLLLFPSDLAHQVKPLSHANNRVSISFNTFISGTLGNETNVNHLVLPG